jgi:hypothetical protein
MRTLSASELLDVWERGQSQHPLDQAISLLAEACPEKSREDLIELSMGQRDTLLFRLRQLSFGAQLEIYSDCPACGAELEMMINVGDLLNQSVDFENKERVEKIGEYLVCFRLPDSAIMAKSINAAGSLDSDFLLKLCVSSITRNGETVNLKNHLEIIRSELNSLFEKIDPLSEVQINSTCAGCGHQWTQILDIFSFFWSELGTQINKLMDQVHLLACSYGWHENEILSLSPWRRQYYLDRVLS